jgi:hypothetical protein
MTTRSWRNDALAAAAVAALFVAFLAVRYRFDSPDIADFPAYAYFTDVYWAGFDRSWLFSEPLGWGMLLLLRNLTGSTDGAIQVAHWLLGISTPLLLLYIARHFNIAWQGTIASVALFGPLLAMVTIRATPAYLLCAVAALLAAKGRLASIGLIVLAMLFHNSAALTLVPVALILLQRRYPSLARPLESRLAIISIAALLSITMLYFRTELFQFIESIIAQTPGSIQKYLVYFAVGNAEAGNAVDTGQDSTFHILFLGGASIVLVSYIFLSTTEQIPFRLFAISSFTIFLLLNINPVTAYRQSLYWIIPLLFTFPWSRLHPKIFFSIFLTLVSAALFGFNLLGVVL